MRKIFFGWWVAVAAHVALVMSYATVGVAGFGLMMTPLSDAFGWQRGEISLGLMFFTLALVAFSPVVGWLIDHWGARRVLIPSIALFGAGIGALFFLTASLWHFYAMYLLLGVFSVGTIPSGYSRIILNWFDQKRGLALAIALAGVGVGFMALPPAVNLIEQTFGWRWVYVFLAACILLISLPVVTLLLREHPGEMGLLPDGAMPSGRKPEPSAEDGYTMREALRVPQFWMLNVSFAVLGVATIGLITHLSPMLQDHGLGPTAVSMAFTALGVMVIFGRIACGWLLDRFFAPYVAVAFMLCPTIGIAIFAAGAQGYMVFIAAALVGIGGGAEFELMSYLASRYLGLRSFGQLYGVLFAAFYLGGGLGPTLLGTLFDNFGEYTVGLWLLAGGFLLAATIQGRLGAYHPWRVRR